MAAPKIKYKSNNFYSTKMKQPMSYQKNSTKKIVLRLLFLSMCTLLIFTSCLKNIEPPVCTSTGETPISNVMGANTTTVNTNIDIAVDFQAVNGCGNFNSFAETTVGDTTYVRTIAKYDGCVCTQDLPTRTGIYKFKRPAAGRYFLKFNKGATSLVHPVTVQ